jgi:hypothetical protein
MPIGSHTIPRFYLEQFANPPRRKGKRGKVWVYQRGKPTQLRATDSQGYENGYFGCIRPDGTFDESLEKHLAKLEAGCNDILVSSKSRLCDLRSLSNRNTLAFYAALLFQRSTVRRKFSAGNWIKLKDPYSKLASNQEYLEDAAEHFSERTGEPITPVQIRRLIQRQSEQFSQKDRIQSYFIADLLFNVEVMKEDFASKPWQVWEAPPGAEFVTSDNPVVTFLRVAEDAWHPGHGIRQPGVVVAFPLAPTACLTMGITGREFEEASEARVTKMNEMVIRSSDRFVYARALSSGVLEMVQELGGTSVPGKNAFIGPFPDEKRVEEHMRRTIGIKKRRSANA